MTLAGVAAVVYALATLIVVGFQIVMALGAPWGRFAMGGRYPEQFPPGLRVSAVVQAVVLIGLAFVVVSDAGLAFPGVVEGRTWLVWLPVAFSAISVVLNAITRSEPERRVWLPVTLVLLGASLIVAVT